MYTTHYEEYFYGRADNEIRESVEDHALPSLPHFNMNQDKDDCIKNNKLTHQECSKKALHDMFAYWASASIPIRTKHLEKQLIPRVTKAFG